MRRLPSARLQCSRARVAPNLQDGRCLDGLPEMRRDIGAIYMNEEKCPRCGCHAWDGAEQNDSREISPLEQRFFRVRRGAQRALNRVVAYENKPMVVLIVLAAAVLCVLLAYSCAR